MTPRMVRTVDMDDIGASLETCIVCGSGDIVSQHVVTFRGREFAMTVASWCEKPECEEDRRLTVLSVGMLPPTALAPAVDPDDKALVEKVARAMQADDVAHGYYAAEWGDYPETDAAYLRNAATALKAVTQ